MFIRGFKEGEESVLREVFCSSIHGNTEKFYTERQQNAWAPADYDEEDWSRRIRQLHPYVMEDQGKIIGYADLQDDGYID